ncbi:MAG: glycosyltransferase family 4 protein [Thermoguttaceae bacterium]
MKLLYITVSMPFGEYESFFIPEVQEMIRQGCDMLIVQRSPDGDCYNRDAAGLDKRSVRRPLLNVEILATALAVALRRPIRTFRAFRRLFHCGSLMTFLKNIAVFPKSLWIARLARKWGAEHIHAQWAMTTGTMGMIASEVSGIPWSCTLHRGDIVENNLLAAKLKHASFVRFIANDGIAIAESLCGRPLQGNVFVLHSCVDMPPQIAFRETLSTPPVLLCAAFLHERKGHQYLIEAVRLLRDSGVTVKLLIAGHGALQAALERQTAECGLQDQIAFLGRVEHSRLLDMFRTGQVDLVVLPTLHEGIPAGLIEPMAYGVPVLSTRVGGVPELLDGDAGVMVPPRDPAALADAIRRIIADAELRQTLVQNGRKRVEEGWAVQPVVAELLRRIGQFTEKHAPLDRP